jgi:hypothetical protein
MLKNAWAFAFAAFVFCTVLPVTPAAAAPTQLEFAITKGKGTPVCDAYLERLRKTVFTDPPFCGRPESDAVKGFDVLHRVPLTAQQVHTLYDRVSSLASRGFQDSQDYVAAESERRGLPFSREPVASIQKFLELGLSVWGYEPWVDIDNDGTPENLIIWNGIGGSFGSSARCGATDMMPGDQMVRQYQLPYVLTPHGDAIDTYRTFTLFGDPSAPIAVGKRFMQFTQFAGVFRFQGTFYFDSFTASEDQPGTNGAETLVVYLRKEKKTRQVCEYRMTARD